MSKKKIITIAFALVLLISVIGLTYAYFAINQSNTSSNVTIVTGNTTLVLEDVDPITRGDQISPNNTSITRYLTIRNEGSVDGYAKLLFKNLVNTFVLDDLTYTLEEVNSDKSSLSTPNIIVDNEVVPKSSTATNIELADGLLIPSNTSKYYKLTINYDYKTDTNQDADLNKVLTSGFIIEEGSKPISNIYCVDDNGDEITCPTTFTMGDRIAIGKDTPQYFRYIRTTNTSDTEHSYNECQDGGAASIACTDADTRHPLENNQLRLLAEYNLNVGSNKNSSVTEGIQHETVKGWLSSGTMYGKIAYGASNNNYSQSNVKIYTDSYATYLNTTYFGGSREASGSAITIEELKMIGCNQSSKTCSGAPNWIYTSSYWSGSPNSHLNAWGVRSDASLTGFPYDNVTRYGVRPVVSISANLLKNKKYQNNNSNENNQNDQDKYISQGYTKVYTKTMTKAFIDCESEDTGWYADFDKDFVITANMILNKNSYDRYLIIGNYDVTNNMNLEIRNNGPRVWFSGGNGKALTDQSIPINKELNILFKWDATNRSYENTISWYGGSTTVTDTNVSKYGKTSETEMIGAADRRNSCTFSSVTINSFNIYEK